MATSVTSPDISVLDFKVLLDMSLAIPTIKITNLSTVINPSQLQWVFEVLSPSGTPIHIGDFAAPDINGVPFTDYTLSEQLPMIFGQLEFSAINPYSVKVYVKDSNSNIFSQTETASICKPTGNNGKNNFGSASIKVESKCNIGKIYVTDQTDTLYKSITGTKVSIDAKLSYPKDSEGNQHADFVTNSMPFLASIINGGAGYALYVAEIYDYDLGGGFTIRVRYSYNNPSFPVWCNVDLCPLFCEIDKLNDLISKNCDPVTRKEQEKKSNLINAKLIKCAIGILQPSCSIDVPATIEEIKEIGGFTCDCCRPMGLTNIGSVVGPNFTLSTNGLGGDANMNFTDDGNGNFTLNYSDYTYTFSICPDSDSSAFSFEQRSFEYTRNTCLKVDLLQLATEIVGEIQSNQDLITIIQSIITQNTGTCSLDYQGLFPNTCDYSVQLSTAVSTDTINYILIDGTSFLAPANLLLTNAPGIISWLNSLSKGTFNAVYDSGAKSIVISSIANTHTVSSISTNQLAGLSRPYQFVSSCGNICNILQLIINYFKNLNLLQIAIGGKISVCSIQPNGTVVNTVFEADAISFNVVQAINQAVCNMASYLSSRGLTSVNMKALFADYTSTTGIPVDGDYFFMSRNGNLTKIPLVEAAKSIFQLLSSDSSVKNVYCAGALCTSVNNCSPVTNLVASPADTTASLTWNTVAGAIGYKYSLDGVNYSQVTGTSKILTGLTTGTMYSFRIYPVYNNGNGVPCEITLSFTTTSAGAGCAAPGSFAATNLTNTGATLNWAAVGAATNYQYRINGGSWITTGNVLTVTVGGLTPGTMYNADVRAIVGGSPCVAISSLSFTTTNDVVILQNNLSGGAAAFVVSKFSTNALNIYGGAPITATNSANVYVPVIGSSYTYTITVVSDVPATNKSVTINHKRAASILHTANATAAGGGVSTDIPFASVFIAQAGDVFEVILAP